LASLEREMGRCAVILAGAEISYRELAERMKKHCMKEAEPSIANKISRGSFSATFMLAALIAIGAETVRVEDV
jgi:hypothetical protein